MDPEIKNINENDKNKRKQIIRISIIVLSIILLLLIILLCFQHCDNLKGLFNKKPVQTETTTQTSTTAPISTDLNPLTGLPGFDKSLAGKRPVAVVISNAVKARPQWGLCSPDICFEGLTEGGITRMLGFYSNPLDIPKLGPIRSARHDFVEIAMGYDSVFCHWGGSTYAYDLIRDENIDSIDGMTYSGKYFFRDDSRSNVGIEHRSNTNGVSLKKAISDLGRRTDLKDGYANPFKFNPYDAPKSLPDGVCNEIAFSFSGSFNRKFKYNETDKLYYDFFNEKSFNDADGNQRAVSNVIVIYCSIVSMNDDKGRIDMRLTEGNGLYASNGTFMNITWKKGTTFEMLKFFDSAGNPLTLNAGKSYVGIVPTARTENTSIG